MSTLNLPGVKKSTEHSCPVFSSFLRNGMIELQIKSNFSYEANMKSQQQQTH